MVRTILRWCTLKDGSARQMCASWTRIYFQNVKADTTLQLDCAKYVGGDNNKQNDEIFSSFNSAKIDLIYIDTNVCHKL